MYKNSVTYWLQCKANAESALLECRPENVPVWEMAIRRTEREIDEIVMRAYQFETENCNEVLSRADACRRLIDQEYYRRFGVA